VETNGKVGELKLKMEIMDVHVYIRVCAQACPELHSCSKIDRGVEEGTGTGEATYGSQSDPDSFAGVPVECPCLSLFGG